ncbi:hypothetical protein [Jannaschia sp. M317]|uniref:hypothetical protein n=1 Tax=Jannaschia sp. M317 TaxID=2867011 RepID=UPI0021A71E12|nr:hypothetical protein [Jannaschia sp. M317]UWQ17071.1 hypothetical protein K3551_14420 [Jannaschia sp. M317]
MNITVSDIDATKTAASSLSLFLKLSEPPSEAWAREFNEQYRVRSKGHYHVQVDGEHIRVDIDVVYKALWSDTKLKEEIGTLTQLANAKLALKNAEKR